MANLPPCLTPTMAGRTCRSLLVIAAVFTFLGAVGFDLFAGEHPTHTLGLVLVTFVVIVMRLRLLGRHDGLFSAVAGTVVAQPALHTVATLDLRIGSHEGGLLHVVVADGAPTLAQMVASMAIVLAVAIGVRLARLLLSVLRRPVQLLMAAPPVISPLVPSSVCTLRHGSMLRWCGWAIEAARRGPPALSVV